MLSACAGQFDAFVDRRRNPGTANMANLYIGPSTLDRPAICYSSWLSSPEEILALAEKECAKTNRKPKFLKQTSYSCRAFIPHHAIYECQ